MFEAHMNISFRMKVKVFVLTLAIATYNDSRILSMQSDRFQTNAFSVSVIILGVTPTHIPLKNRWPIGRNDCIHACQPFVCLPLEESNSFVRCHVAVACGWYSNLLWWVNNKLDVLWTCLDWEAHIYLLCMYTLSWCRGRKSVTDVAMPPQQEYECQLSIRSHATQAGFYLEVRRCKGPGICQADNNIGAG